MKSKNTIVLLVALIALLLAALIAGGAIWWRLQGSDKPGTPARVVTPEVDARNYKYISLDKVIVMLRGRPGEPMSHYLAIDLVFKTPEEQEKTVKEHLPLLRAVAVRSLSSYTMDKAGLMTIDQLTHDINRAFAESYKREQREKPFAEVMISKLIIE